jgi:hypothetical protein
MMETAQSRDERGGTAAVAGRIYETRTTCESKIRYVRVRNILKGPLALLGPRDLHIACQIFATRLYIIDSRAAVNKEKERAAARESSSEDTDNEIDLTRFGRFGSIVRRNLSGKTWSRKHVRKHIATLSIVGDGVTTARQMFFRMWQHYKRLHYKHIVVEV